MASMPASRRAAALSPAASSIRVQLAQIGRPSAPQYEGGSRRSSANVSAAAVARTPTVVSRVVCASSAPRDADATGALAGISPATIRPTADSAAVPAVDPPTGAPTAAHRLHAQSVTTRRSSESASSGRHIQSVGWLMKEYLRHSSAWQPLCRASMRTGVGEDETLVDTLATGDADAAVAGGDGGVVVGGGGAAFDTAVGSPAPSSVAAMRSKARAERWGRPPWRAQLSWHHRLSTLSHSCAGG